MPGAGSPGPRARKLDDVAIMAVTGVLAGCGLVYEYLLAHAAGRILGAVEAVIFTMIGVMIVAMGIGAFLARTVREPFAGFAWLEAVLAALGGVSVLVLGGITALIVLLPQTLAETFALPPDLVPRGGLVETLDGATCGVWCPRWRPPLSPSRLFMLSPGRLMPGRLSLG